MYNIDSLAIFGENEEAVSSFMARVASEIHIWLDNLDVEKNAENITKRSNKVELKFFKKAMKTWFQNRKKITAQSIFSNKEIEKNGIAD